MDTADLILLHDTRNADQGGEKSALFFGAFVQVMPDITDMQA